MIAFIAGTTAELIKLAPVHHELVRRGTRPLLWFTGWHVRSVPSVLRDLELPEPDVWLRPGSAPDLDRVSAVPAWASRVVGTLHRRRRELAAALRTDGRPPLVVVHGDTFTTVVGSYAGRHLLDARVAHIEAGLRSGSLLSPFPEELDRRLAARAVDLHFAPTQREVDNLRRARGTVVETQANTVVDAVRFALRRDSGAGDLPARYAVATLHRFELLSRPEQYREALGLLKDASAGLPVLYLAGAPEREHIARHQLEPLFDERFQLRPKKSYLDFLPVLAGATFVVTDSGGLQEECAYLGIPCAIHRRRTERHLGLDQNVVLTGMDPAVLREFLSDYERRRRPSAVDAFHPSRVIVDSLARLGYVG